MGLLILIVAIGVLFMGYAFLIETYRRWFLQVPSFTPAVTGNDPAITFSVIIPARNEEERIYDCLLTILEQRYASTNFEVIVVDDHSTDNTPLVVRGLQQKYSNLQLINLKEVLGGKALNSYKKKAIDVAIGYSKHEWIITTDADCFVNAEWLQTFNQFIEACKPMFVAAPVAYIHEGSFVSTFQSLDFMSLQGITAAAVNQNFHSMCNGANLAYNKEAFYKVDGFKGIDNIASGDDMLLMHKIYKQYPKQVKFLSAKEAIVRTEAMKDWRSFFNQRIRWASKADKFDDKRILLVLIFVYFVNCLFLFLLVASFWKPILLVVVAGMLLLKTLIELRFIYPVAKFFNEQHLLKWFPVMQPVHIGYTIIAGWLGKFGKYTWKGRTVK